MQFFSSTNSLHSLVTSMWGITVQCHNNTLVVLAQQQKIQAFHPPCMSSRSSWGHTSLVDSLLGDPYAVHFQSSAWLHFLSFPCMVSGHRSRPPTWAPQSSTHHFCMRIWSSLYTQERTISLAISHDPWPCSSFAPQRQPWRGQSHWSWRSAAWPAAHSWQRGPCGQSYAPLGTSSP